MLSSFFRFIFEQFRLLWPLAIRRYFVALLLALLLVLPLQHWLVGGLAHTGIWEKWLDALPFTYINDLLKHGGMPSNGLAHTLLLMAVAWLAGVLMDGGTFAVYRNENGQWNAALFWQQCFRLFWGNLCLALFFLMLELLFLALCTSLLLLVTHNFNIGELGHEGILLQRIRWVSILAALGLLPFWYWHDASKWALAAPDGTAVSPLRSIRIAFSALKPKWWIVLSLYVVYLFFAIGLMLIGAKHPSWWAIQSNIGLIIALLLGQTLVLLRIGLKLATWRALSGVLK